jgi:hypothetical protein
VVFTVKAGCSQVNVDVPDDAVEAGSIPLARVDGSSPTIGWFIFLLFTFPVVCTCCRNHGMISVYHERYFINHKSFR